MNVPPDLRAKIAHALGNVPKLRARDRRDALLHALPKPLARAEDPPVISS
jgi:hypothetical protein